MLWLLPGSYSTAHHQNKTLLIKKNCNLCASDPIARPLARAQDRMTPPIEAAKARLTELEVRLPWTSVKKSWGPRREQWVSQVLAIVTSEALGAQLLSLEVRVLCALRPTCSHIQCAGDPPARTGLHLFTLPGLNPELDAFFSDGLDPR